MGGLPAAHAVVAAETPAATVAVAHAAPLHAVHAPALVHAAPAVHTTVHTAPVVQHVGYQVHPQVSVQKHVTHHTTQHVINHAPVVGAYAGLPLAGLPLAGLPVVAAAAPAEESE